jgi:hypothetical protein
LDCRECFFDLGTKSCLSSLETFTGESFSMFSYVSDSVWSRSWRRAFCFLAPSVGKTGRSIAKAVESITGSTVCEGRALRRFFKAALDPIAIILCLEWLRLRSIAGAPICHSASWSTAHFAERFHNVPQALLTIVKLGDFSWSNSTCRQLCRRNTSL